MRTAPRGRGKLGNDSGYSDASHVRMGYGLNHLAMVELTIVGALAEIQYYAQRNLFGAHLLQLLLGMAPEPLEQFRID